MRIEDLSSWQAFLKVAEHASFTKAGSVLRQSPSQLSKRVAKLEDDLGVRLFQRSTRVVNLTEEGKALFPKVAAVLDDLTEIESSFTKSSTISGSVKITCVPYVGHCLMAPVLKKCAERYPDLQVSMELSKKFVNLIEGGFDMAIRIETPQDSDLVYTKLAPNELVFCASPSYLKQFESEPRQPSDLAQHNLLALTIHDKCKFKGKGANLGESIKRRHVTCDNGVFLTELALDGQGILVRSKWGVADHLSSGALVEVMQDAPFETFGHIYAVIPSKRYLAPRVRALLELVKQQAATSFSMSQP